MLRALVKLTTGVELGGIAMALFAGISFVAFVSLGMHGTAAPLVEGSIAVVTVGIVGLIGRGIWRRYQRIRGGRCGHMSCSGNLDDSAGLPNHLVACSNCKWVWPRISAIRIPAEVS